MSKGARELFAKRTAWEIRPNPWSQALERAEGKRELLDLTSANPTREGLFDARLLELLTTPQATDYAPSARGERSTREALTADYGARGCAADPDRLLLTATTSEAYGYLFRLLCDPDDEVLVPEPSYPLLRHLCDIHDVRLVPYPLPYEEGFRLDVEALSARCNERTRAVVAVSPNNPTGTVLRDAEITALDAWASDHRIAVIADEVFGDYLDDGSVSSFVGRRLSALTFVLSGLSKVLGAPQLKLAWMWIGGPDAPCDAAISRLEIIADAHLSVAAPVARAAPAMLTHRAAIQARIRARLTRNLSSLDERLATIDACPVRRLPRDGGWYAVLEVPRHHTDERWCVQLVEQDGVLAFPGYFFDFDREGLVVVSLLVEPARFDEGVRRIARRLTS